MQSVHACGMNFLRSGDKKELQVRAAARPSLLLRLRRGRHERGEGLRGGHQGRVGVQEERGRLRGRGPVCLGGHMTLLFSSLAVRKAFPHKNNDTIWSAEGALRLIAHGAMETHWLVRYVVQDAVDAEILVREF